MMVESEGSKFDEGGGDFVTGVDVAADSRVGSLK